MVPPVRGFGTPCLALLAGTILAALPAAAQARGIAFRNELNLPIVVQGTSIVNNMVRQGRPFLLYPNKSGMDQIPAAGNRLIVIYDANQPSRVLYKDVVPYAGKEMHFAVQVDPPANPRERGPLKAKLVPVKPPPASPPSR